MLVGLLDGQPVTGGAFRRFDAETAELKRIWTDSRYRRRGYAKALLAELEAEIAARGYRRVYLTTGDRQPEAEALYLSSGYTGCDEPLPAEGEVYPGRVREGTAAMSGHLHLAVALDGYGWHPEAWRTSPGAEPVTSGRYWSDLAVTAERGLLDFVTFDDALTPQRRRRPEIEPAGLPEARCRAGRIEGRAADPSHRSHSGRDRHPHRAVSHLQSHCHT